MAYIGFSKSERAAEAYRRGLRPASKIGHGIPADLISKYVVPKEWHHCSKMFNEVDFYDPEEVLATFGIIQHEKYPPDPDAIADLAKWREDRLRIKVYENCIVEWLEWSGHPATRWREANWKAIKKTASGCRVTVKGRFVTVELPGGKTMRKRLDTNGFSFKQQDGADVSPSGSSEMANTI